MPTQRASSDAAVARHLLRERTGQQHVILAGRGSAAIYATLRALDFHDRDVLIPANTCYIVLWAVLQSGNRPRLVDIDPNTGNLSAETLARCGIERPAVLIPAHMYGLPAPMESIMAWTREHGAFALEDAALALASAADGRPTGAWGDAAVFSFGPGKIADAELGGALVTDDDQLAGEVKRILGEMPLYDDRTAALNRQWLELYWPLHQFDIATPRLSSLYPALFELYGEITRYRLPNAAWRPLRASLGHLGGEIDHRRALAQRYDDGLADLPVTRFDRPDGATLWCYPLRAAANRRDTLLQTLWSEQIFEATRWYPSLQPMAAALAPDVAQTPTPFADQMAAEIINLPLAPETTQADVEVIVETVRGFFASE
jgi:dTDP-4-amino-4,6-dideoxygalactose transaminase